MKKIFAEMLVNRTEVKKAYDAQKNNEKYEPLTQEQLEEKTTKLMNTKQFKDACKNITYDDVNKIFEDRFSATQIGANLENVHKKALNKSKEAKNAPKDKAPELQKVQVKQKANNVMKV